MQHVNVRVALRNHGNDCYVFLDDKTTGELFAAAPLEHDPDRVPLCIEPTIDSSRYFVCKVVDITGEASNSDGTPKHAFLGLGFPDRQTAGDFRAAIDDYTRMLRRERAAEEARKKHEEQQAEQTRTETDWTNGNNAELGAADSSREFAHSPSGKIKISVPNARGKRGKRSSSAETTAGGNNHSVPTPPPPPPPPPSTSRGTPAHRSGELADQQQETQNAGWATFDDDEFGAFEG